MAYGTYQTRNPKAVHSPIRSLPLYGTARAIFRPTARQLADNALFIARRDLPGAEMFVATAYAALGRANQMRRPEKRHVCQAMAMRQINRARAELRAARKALVAAEAALLALDGDLFGRAA